jgi:hypothetical protein
MFFANHFFLIFENINSEKKYLKNISYIYMIEHFAYKSEYVYMFIDSKLHTVSYFNTAKTDFE